MTQAEVTSEIVLTVPMSLLLAFNSLEMFLVWTVRKRITATPRLCSNARQYFFLSILLTCVLFAVQYRTPAWIGALATIAQGITWCLLESTRRPPRERRQRFPRRATAGA